MDLDKAKSVASATVWSGDARVNFMTVHKAANVLARRVEELENTIHLARIQYLGCGGRLTPSEIVEAMNDVLDGG